MNNNLQTEDHAISEGSKRKKKEIWSAYWPLIIIITELCSVHFKSKPSPRKVQYMKSG